MSIRKVSYGTATIQKLRRVALDANLLETLGLAVGDTVKIELDTEHETVLITPATVRSAKVSMQTRRKRV